MKKIKYIGSSIILLFTLGIKAESVLPNSVETIPVLNEMYTELDYKLTLVPNQTSYKFELPNSFKGDIKDLNIVQEEGSNVILKKSLKPYITNFDDYLKILCENKVDLTVIDDNTYNGKCIHYKPLTLDSGYVFSDINNVKIKLSDLDSELSHDITKNILTLTFDEVSEPIETTWKMSFSPDFYYSFGNNLTLENLNNYESNSNITIKTKEYNVNFNGKNIEPFTEIQIPLKSIAPKFEASSTFIFLVEKNGSFKQMNFPKEHKIILSNFLNYNKIYWENKELTNNVIYSTKPLVKIQLIKGETYDYDDFIKKKDSELSALDISNIKNMHDSIPFFERNGEKIQEQTILLNNTMDFMIPIEIEFSEESKNSFIYSKDFLRNKKYISYNMLQNETKMFKIYTFCM